MKDTELHKAVLQTYYDLRDRGPFQWIEEDVPADKFPPVESFTQLARICSQLAEEDLIEWRPIRGGNGQVVGGSGQIKGRGIRVIEGSEKPPVGMIVNNIHNAANVQLGDHNSISTAVNIDRINTAIESSHFSAAEKAEAKSILQKVCENRLLNTIIGSAVGEATKTALSK